MDGIWLGLTDSIDLGWEEGDACMWAIAFTCMCISVCKHARRSCVWYIPTKVESGLSIEPGSEYIEVGMVDDLAKTMD